MIQYMSITSDGVDVAEYYKNCGTYITEIAKRSGVCRGTVTHVIAGCAQESSSKAILEVLEQKSDEIYQQDIAACEAEVQIQMDDPGQVICTVWDTAPQRAETKEGHIS